MTSLGLKRRSRLLGFDLGTCLSRLRTRRGTCGSWPGSWLGTYSSCLGMWRGTCWSCLGSDGSLTWLNLTWNLLILTLDLLVLIWHLLVLTWDLWVLTLDLLVLTGNLAFFDFGLNLSLALLVLIKDLLITVDLVLAGFGSELDSGPTRLETHSWLAKHRFCPIPEVLKINYEIKTRNAVKQN